MDNKDIKQVLSNQVTIMETLILLIKHTVRGVEVKAGDVEIIVGDLEEAIDETNEKL